MSQRPLPNSAGNPLMAQAASWPLIAAGVALAISLLLLIPWSVQASILGYLFAPLAVTGLVSIYTFQDIKASQSVWYAGKPIKRKVGTALVVIALAVGLTHSWLIATEFAKAWS